MQKLLIVGNEAMPGRLGPVLDRSFARIVRGNRFSILNRRDVVGSRVDVVAMHPYRLYDTLFMAGEIWWPGSKKFLTDRTWHEERRRFYRIQAALDRRKQVFVEDLPDGGQKWFELQHELAARFPRQTMSFWFRVILMAAMLHPDHQIYLAGFDWFQDGYAFKFENRLTAESIWQWEGELIREMIANGRVKSVSAGPSRVETVNY